MEAKDNEAGRMSPRKRNSMKDVGKKDSGPICLLMETTDGELDSPLAMSSKGKSEGIPLMMLKWNNVIWI